MTRDVQARAPIYKVSHGIPRSVILTKMDKFELFYHIITTWWRFDYKLWGNQVIKLFNLPNHVSDRQYNLTFQLEQS